MQAQTVSTRVPEPAPDPARDQIRLLLMQARHALATDPADAERCIAVAVRLLPQIEIGSEPKAFAAPVMQRGGLAPWQVLRIKAMVEARLTERISSAEMAAAARLSPSHFSRAFRISFGDAPKAYVNRRRIARSKTMMLDGSDSLAAIALACGLSDQAHFCRMFRRFEGMSPSVWRRLSGGAGQIERPAVAVG
ncbi:helix-turn-helix domain-containing protein [Caulobacter endophyticus]|uniref:helix-turn-helix domain-containing protein n=1 Tax=Caulobacter endophyticus TaxID=2172652 RepID=UPI00240FC47A|nr:AraC family transcriptional regulator [Caulobacter endophyticus]MDG2530728.1 AraC family transcriptional regulator [Caulobacter endophyticus]